MQGEGLLLGAADCYSAAVLRDADDANTRASLGHTSRLFLISVFYFDFCFSIRTFNEKSKCCALSFPPPHSHLPKVGVALARGGTERAVAELEAAARLAPDQRSSQLFSLLFSLKIKILIKKEIVQ